ncbi:MAG: TetR/AcrR family transcriptional regulator [Rhizobacter sp.]
MAALKTRDRILAVSLALFNDEGLAGVSTHRIAAELDMSPGNLHYHFRTKALIVTWLFRRFEERFAPCIDASASITALDDLWLSLHLTFEAIDEYRFIYRDIEVLLRDFPELRPRAQALTARNLIAAKALCAGLAEAGVIRASPEDVEMLALQIVFSTTCWFSFQRLTPPQKAPAYGPAALAAYYTLTLLSPYVVGESKDYLNYLRAKYLK